MLQWMKRRGWAPRQPRARAVKGPPVHSRVMSGKYLLLYNYLNNRYADNVVLTFSEIEDLLGFSLPDQARQDPAWWTDPRVAAGPNHSDSWTLASRTAAPDLRARTVAFERVI
jgi:hypothetical protein